MSKLILSKCAFNFHPIAVVFYERKEVGWEVKVVINKITYTFHSLLVHEPTASEARLFVEQAANVKTKPS
jgi:hypothetical protein